MDENSVPSQYQRLDRSIAELMISYHELNSSKVEELNGEPTPLEFMRFVAQNRPFVARGGAKDWKAARTWNASYLQQVMGGRNVTVAATLDGRADSVSVRHGQDVFTRPAYIQEPFEEVLAHIREQEIRNSLYQNETEHSGSQIVKYLQAQDDSLRTEYEELMNDVPPSIPFARIALQREPDAVNFWLGNSKSVTQLHKDNYENIYVQILGKKHFVLLPPVDAAAVCEKSCLAADHECNKTPGNDAVELSLKYDDSNGRVPFPTWDPDEPCERATKFSKLAVAIRLTLNEGDMLYLPAQWYHKVSQSCNSEGICCAVNYWYDMDYSGTFHPATSFIRSTADLAT